MSVQVAFYFCFPPLARFLRRKAAELETPESTSHAPAELDALGQPKILTWHRRWLFRMFVLSYALPLTALVFFNSNQVHRITPM